MLRVQELLFNSLVSLKGYEITIRATYIFCLPLVVSHLHLFIYVKCCKELWLTPLNHNSRLTWVSHCADPFKKMTSAKFIKHCHKETAFLLSFYSFVYCNPILHASALCHMNVIQFQSDRYSFRYTHIQFHSSKEDFNLSCRLRCNMSRVCHEMKISIFINHTFHAHTQKKIKIETLPRTPSCCGTEIQGSQVRNTVNFS